MRLLVPEHIAALTDPLTWADNPFVRRDARRDRKRQQPTRSFAWMAGVLLVFGGLGMAGLWALAAHGLGNAWFLGGDLSTALCILVCGVHIYYVAGAAQKHTTRMLAEEVSHNTLSSLLLLPISPFQLVLQSMVYPWLAGMRAGLALLPLYMLCVGLGGVTWTDILMLYFVFAFSAVSIPRWNRPMLHEDVALSTPTAEPAGMAARSAANQNANANLSSFSFGQLASISCILLFFLFTFNRGNLAAVHDFVRRYLPESLFVLLPTSFLSWPLLVARGLITPFDWYGFRVPPLPFVLIFFLIGRYTQIVRVSEWLQVGRYRDLALLPTYQPRRRLEGLLQIGLAYVWTGYLWRWAVRDGALSGWVARSGPSDAPGLPGFVYLLLFLTIYGRGLGRAGMLASWYRAGLAQRAKPAVPRLIWRSAPLYLAAPFAFAFCFYLACCATARIAPFPAGVLPLAGRMIAVGMAGMLLRYGAVRLSDATLLLALLIPPLVLILHAVRTEIHLPSATVHQLAYISPVLGLVNLGNPRAIFFFRIFGLGGVLTPPLPWQNWVLTGGLGGLACALLTARRRRAPALPSGVVALDPTQVGREVFMDRPVAQARAEAQAESSLVRALLAWAQRLSDNAVMMKELRVRLRGKLRPLTVRRTFLTYLVVTLALYFVPGIASTFGSGFARMMFSPLNALDQQTAAGVLGLWYIAPLFVSPFAGIAILPYIFAVEREKSTLGFTLTTPMRSISIAAGKVLGLLLPNSLSLVTLGIWTLLLSLFFSPLLGAVEAITVWGGVMVTALSIAVTSGMIALAVASLFPRRLTVRLGSVAQALLFYGVIIGSQLLYPLARSVAEWTGLSFFNLWLVWFGFALGISILCLLIATWAISRMRRTDFVIGAGRRDN